MKVIITGSLGNISKPLAKRLIGGGYEVTIVTSKMDKKEQIEALGAKAAVGSVEDVAFLTDVFKDADIAYCMTPPNYYYDPSIEPIAFTKGIGQAYADAIKASGLKKIIHLSSFGADISEGTGFILGAYEVEKIFATLPEEVIVTTLRPTYFNYNLLAFVQPIKYTGVIAANYGGDGVIPIVSPFDIANAISEEIEHPSPVRKIRYISSDEVTGNEIAEVIGKAIGKPDLTWKIISDEEMLGYAKQGGMNDHNAQLFVDMARSIREGRLAADYYRNKPTLGHIKLKDFAIEFASAYQKS